MRVPWIASRLNQSIIKNINPEYALEGLKLKLPILWAPVAKRRLPGKDSDSGKIEGKRRRRLPRRG